MFWQVPTDAQIMDMVFADSGDTGAGFVDNNKGLDYHVPVAGSGIPARRLKVVHVTVEMAPVAKVRASPLRRRAEDSFVVLQATSSPKG
jgi:starch synthase